MRSGSDTASDVACDVYAGACCAEPLRNLVAADSLNVALFAFLILQFCCDTSVHLTLVSAALPAAKTRVKYREKLFF